MQEMQETQIRSLGQEDPLEEEMATHSNILARKIPWTEEPSGLQSMSGKQSDMTELLSTDLQPLDTTPSRRIYQMARALDLNKARTDITGLNK